MSGKKATIIFVLGCPASGKGTYGKLLRNQHEDRYYHLSAGDLLRELINPIDGPLRDNLDIVTSVKSGGTKGLVSAETITEILIAKIKEEMAKGKDVFLLDGFPRSLAQKEAFEEGMAKEFQLNTPDLVLLFSCPKDVAKARYKSRKRSGDDDELFEGRYQDYQTRDSQVVELYRDFLIEVNINGEMTKDEAFQLLLEKMRSNKVVQGKGIL